MGATRTQSGRWRIILGHGSSRRYVYCDSWEEAEKEIRCERTEAKVRDAKRGSDQEEPEKQPEQKPKSSRTEKQKTEKQTFENESYRK